MPWPSVRETQLPPSVCVMLYNMHSASGADVIPLWIFECKQTELPDAFRAGWIVFCLWPSPMSLSPTHLVIVANAGSAREGELLQLLLPQHQSRQLAGGHSARVHPGTCSPLFVNFWPPASSMMRLRASLAPVQLVSCRRNMPSSGIPFPRLPSVSRLEDRQQAQQQGGRPEMSHGC